MPKLTIAIDGPAGSGKSSVARLVAGILGYLYLDSGAMYRALALKALQRGAPLDDETQLAKLANETHIELKPPAPEQEKAGIKNRVFLDAKEVTQEIRTPEVAQAASRLATIAPVRAVLVAEQQRAGAGGGVVMEGRDIGTVVFPDADLKFFLDASPEARSQRRYEQVSPSRNGDDDAGTHVHAAIAKELRERDARDRNRADSPLRAADDAIVIDSTNMSLNEVLNLIEDQVRDHLHLPVVSEEP